MKNSLLLIISQRVMNTKTRARKATMPKTPI
jgi:hypothetical protein